MWISACEEKKTTTMQIWFRIFMELSEIHMSDINRFNNIEDSSVFFGKRTCCWWTGSVTGNPPSTIFQNDALIVVCQPLNEYESGWLMIPQNINVRMLFKNSTDSRDFSYASRLHNMSCKAQPRSCLVFHVLSQNLIRPVGKKGGPENFVHRTQGFCTPGGCG